MGANEPTKHLSITSTFSMLESQRNLITTFPKLKNSTAIISMMLTTIISAYGAIFGPISIVTFYILWLPRTKYKRIFLLRPSKDLLYCILFSGFSCVSVLWSDYPATSFYTGLELVSTMMCLIIMAKIVSTEAFIQGIVLGGTLVLIASLISNNYGLDPFSGTYTLVGLFGSKNQLGLFAEITALLSLLSLLIKQNIFKKFFYCLAPLCISLVVLYLCRSATSVVSLAFIILFLTAVYCITRLPVNYRPLSFAFVAVWLIAAANVGMALNWQALLFKSVGKDNTLTGRTVLWDHGMKIGWDRSILGHGYSAFWIRGNPPAEHLWFDFGMYGRGGFHFHNLFIELFVELGIVGVIIMIGMMTATLYKCLRLTLRHGMILEYIFPLCVSVMFIIRALVELDIMSAFSIGTIMCFSILPRLAAYQREQAEKTSM